MSQLSIVERAEIIALRREHKSFRYIARVLGRAPSTITREFKRNVRPRLGYDAVDAQMKALKRRTQQRRQYKFRDYRIRDYVTEALKKKISPVQISGRMLADIGLSISPEAIYQFVYRDKVSGGSLWKNLRRKRRRRKSRIKNRARKPRIKNRRGIEERPSIVELKSRFGDLEVDTVIGKGHKGAIVTIVDRASKHLWAQYVERKTAVNVENAIKELLVKVKAKIKTITADNGSEFMNHQEISRWAKVFFYFANPYCSWQRGLNEHTNGLLRQYYPKKTWFNSETLKDLDLVVDQINSRPRTALNFKTPKEKLQELTGISYHQEGSLTMR